MAHNSTPISNRSVSAEPSAAEPIDIALADGEPVSTDGTRLRSRAGSTRRRSHRLATHLVSRIRGPLMVARGPLDAWRGRREPRVLEVHGRARTQPGASGTGQPQRDFGRAMLAGRGRQVAA